MIRIGIGLITYNGNKRLTRLINSIQLYTTKLPYTLFCSVDGSTDGTINNLINRGIEFSYAKSEGPSLAINSIFRRFIHYNYILILRDYLEITNENWLESFISAAGLFNIPHLTVGMENDNILDEETMGNYILNWTPTYKPMISFYVRKVIERIGGIDGRFKEIINLGQEEHYTRMVQGKLMPKKEGFPDLKNVHDYINIHTDEKSGFNFNFENGQDLLRRTVSENKQTHNIFRKL